MSVRIECGNIVLRLFPSLASAERACLELGCGHLNRFEPVEHESKTGWLVRDRQSLRLYDDAGLIKTE